MQYQLDNEVYEVEIVKKNNKNTYIRVKDNKTIYVTTGYFTTKKHIINLLDNNKEFLRKALTKVEKNIEKSNKFYLLGIEYKLIQSSNIKGVSIDTQNKIIYSENEKK